ncbi:hypothetical protein H8B09_10645 [Paenibacillus sp. PR3]|uniref:Uncharacterized protein n=1 Tax=Paenibacillus terricola TaxID=2763503 RepID=A0ABR8MTC1_9BACL|nr:hypothetical protein [Paenibacillus terricola]MBD3919211.1 hypothetical protein [Paenibacillus terricola]
MPNSAYWFLGLSVSSILLLTYTLFHAKSTVRAIFLFLIMTQIAYMIETIIYIFGSSYTYLPGLLKNNAYYDSNMGALTSNLLVIPTAAIIIAVFEWRWKAIAALIVFIGVIEWVFVLLEIYKLNWWRIEYTAGGLVFYFSVAKLLYSRLLRPVNGMFHSLLLFLCIAPIMGTLHILPIMLFMNRSYDPSWFNDPAHDTTACASLYYIVSSCMIVAIMKLQQGHVWLKYCGIAVFILVLTLELVQTEMLTIHKWWDPWFYCLFPATVYLLLRPISTRLARGA